MQWKCSEMLGKGRTEDFKGVENWQIASRITHRSFSALTMQQVTTRTTSLWKQTTNSCSATGFEIKEKLQLQRNTGWKGRGELSLGYTNPLLLCFVRQLIFWPYNTVAKPSSSHCLLWVSSTVSETPRIGLLENCTIRTSIPSLQIPYKSWRATTGFANLWWPSQKHCLMYAWHLGNAGAAAEQLWRKHTTKLSCSKPPRKVGKRNWWGNEGDGR